MQDSKDNKNNTDITDNKDNKDITDITENTPPAEVIICSQIQSDANTLQDEEFELIECAQEEEPLTRFAVEDREKQQVIMVEVIDYTSEKSFVLMTTEKYVIKVSRRQGKLQETRTVAEMCWLRNTMMLRYPGIGIPVFVIEASTQNLAKQKCIVAEEFLKFLANHEVLRYSPELKAFLSDRIEYLNMKKEIEGNTKILKSHPQIYQLSSIFSLIKWKQHSASVTKSLDVPKMNKMLSMEPMLRSTILSLARITTFTQRTNELTKQILMGQKNLLQLPQISPQYTAISQKIRQSISDNQGRRQNKQSLEYLSLGIKVEMVHSNLKGYLEWFGMMGRLEGCILSLRESGKHSQSYNKLGYLRLLVNNMQSDVDEWLSYNNEIIQDALNKMPPTRAD